MSILTLLLTSCNSGNNEDRQAPSKEEIGEVLSLISTNIKSKDAAKGVSYLIYYDNENFSYVNSDTDTISLSSTIIVYKNKYTITIINQDVPRVFVASTLPNLVYYPSQEHYFKSLAGYISRGFSKAKKAKEHSTQGAFHGYLLWTEYLDETPVLRFEKK